MATSVEDEDEGALVDPLDGFLGYHLRRASARVLADLGYALGEVGLRPAEASALLLIEANPNITQSDIGRMLGIQRANMAPLTAALLRAGFIRKWRTSGRSQALRLTKAGATTAREIIRRMEAHETGLLRELSPRQRRKLLDILRGIWA